MANYKIQRLAADISQEISNIIANEANDSLLKTITITGCEVTNDEAHEIGIRLAEELWGDKFQVIVATHTNTKNKRKQYNALIY